MNSRWTMTQELRRLRSLEQGTPFPSVGRRLALLHPTPYRSGMASLGYQWVGSQLAEAGYSVERAFLPEDPAYPGPVLTLETGSPLGDFDLVAISIAWELELPGLVRALEISGIPALRTERRPGHPRILVGGPLTFANADPLAPLADAILAGEADDTVVAAVGALLEGPDGGATLAALPGARVPPDVVGPPPACVARDRLPARSRIWTPEAGFADMFLVEGVRGCARACMFCVMRRGTGTMRVVPEDRILAAVPPDARRVGLVGAGIGDHPALARLVATLAGEGREVGVSALRADRLVREPEVVRWLHRAGNQTLTIASDAASQRLRDTIHKGVDAADLVACARIAAEARVRSVKLYVMLGLPGETDDDLTELADLARQMAALRPLILGVSPFVPKRGTPLADAPFAGVRVLEDRLGRLTRALRGVAEVRTDGARTAWLEAVLARGGDAEGEAVVRAVRAGGGMAALRRELKALGWDQ